MHSQFGAQGWPFKAALKALPSWFENSSKQVRDEAAALTAEMHRWRGVALKQLEGQLRPAQLKDLAEAVDQLPKEPPQAQRHVRGRDPVEAASASAAGAAEAGP